MHIAAVDVPVPGQRGHLCLAAAHVDLIPFIAQSVQPREHPFHTGKHPRRLPLHLLPVEHGLHLEQSHAPQFRQPRGLDAIRVRDGPAQHLVSAAHAEYQRPARRLLQDRGFQSPLTQPAEIGDRALRPRQNDHVRRAERAHMVDIPQRHIFIPLKRRKIGKIRNFRQPDDRDVDQLPRRVARKPLRQAVLIVDVRRRVRHHTRHRHAAERLELPQPRLQNGPVAAELVHDRPLDARTLVRLQQRDRPVELREHAAPVDVPDQQHRRVHQLCQPHVHKIVLLQVDLRRAARALNDDHVILRREALIRRRHRGQKLPFPPVIFRRPHVAHDLSVHDHLTAGVCRRLQQDRVHPHIRRDARRLRLHHLRPPHLAALGGDEGVQRHILALERGHAIAVLPENAAERRGEQALPRVRHRPLQHQIQRHLPSSIARRIAPSSASFSSRSRTAARYHPGPRPSKFAQSRIAAPRSRSRSVNPVSP